MNQTKTPNDLWYLATEYAAYLLNHLAIESLDWKTPIEVATGETPDNSNLLQFHQYQKVYYYDPKAAFPTPKEKIGRFVGVAENVGDTLTYKILTDDMRQVIYHSVVHAAEKEEINQHAEEHDDIEKKVIFNEDDVRDNVNYPEVNVEQLIGFKFIKKKGSHNYRAEVLKLLDEDEDTYLVKIGDSGHEEIYHYNDLVYEWEKQQNNPIDDVWTFKEILEH